MMAMKKMLFWVLPLSLSIGGCCTRQELDNFSRFEGTTNKPSEFCGIFSGFGTIQQPERWTAAYSPVTVSEYGELVCAQVEQEQRASCINLVWNHYRQAQRKTPDFGESTSGPFAIVIRDDLLLGSYRSDPFSADFEVKSQQHAGLGCRGRYSALDGDTKAQFAVTCDNGQQGHADIVLDRYGRNGIGKLYLTDGTVGNIVFGHTTVGGALTILKDVQAAVNAPGDP